ncbi:MAG: hypothetical protein CSA96_04230 [Bacteroidetes bacterium]|nr:MAG: hypothetical protein CSA96_04230 [Bacteroidota bacterium]
MKRFFPVLFSLLVSLPAFLLAQEKQRQEAQAPSASIQGLSNWICLGDSVAADVRLYGNGPWEFDISNEDSVYATYTNVSTSFIRIWLKPVEDNVFKISRLVDVLGVEGTGLGQVLVDVYPTPEVSILLDRSAFIKTEGPVTLMSDPPGGVFSGIGVTSNKFYPAYAPPESSPHTIRCVYTNTYGCSDTDEKDLIVIHGDAEVQVLQNGEAVTTICDDGLSYPVRGSNSDGVAGTFRLEQVEPRMVLDSYLIDDDENDNEALLNPAGLSGTYDLIYSYSVDALELVDTTTILVNDLGPLYLAGLPALICGSDEPYVLSPGGPSADSGADYSFSGPGVSGSMEDGYFFDPGSEDAFGKEISIHMDYTSSNGCLGSVDSAVMVHPTPTLGFDFSPACIAEAGGSIALSNTTEGKDLVERWAWDFGDPESGNDNTSEQENPSHFYSRPGPLQIQLEAETSTGCIATMEMDTVLADIPRIDFSLLHNCYNDGGAISIRNRTSCTYTTLDSLIWHFYDEDERLLDSLISLDPDEVPEYVFPSTGLFNVALRVVSAHGCEAALTKTTDLRPTVVVDEDGYSQNFNGTAHAWKAYEGGDGMSWTLGKPGFNGFLASDDAWYTDLPNQGDYLERSWVESPCFDFSKAGSLQMRFDILRSFYPGVEGAVIQYDKGKGDGWKTLGTSGDGINWYNVEDVYHEPGGSAAAWSNTYPFHPDTEWQKAVHHLDMLSGEAHTKFRVVIATGGRSNMGNQGFAFDNFELFEQSKRYLLEYFTNAGSTAALEADELVDSLSAQRPSGLVTLEYHTAYPGNDVMNERYPYGAETRSVFYGISVVPYAILNGGVGNGHRFTFTDEANSPSGEMLSMASEEEPAFDIDLDVKWGEEELQLTAEVECLTDTFHANLQLYLVLIEKEVTNYTGANQDTIFRNVVLDMLPNPGGKLLGSEWSSGKVVTTVLQANYPDYVEDLKDLALAAFVQDRQSGLVLQATIDHLDKDTGIKLPPGMERRELSLYPNPARDRLFVNLGSALNKDARLLIYGPSGAVVEEAELPAGYQIRQIDVSALPEGMYIVRCITEGQLDRHSKFIRLR